LVSPDEIRIGINFKAGSLKQRNPAFQPSKPANGALTRIVDETQILKTDRSDRRHLRDVLAGFHPMEMRSVAGSTTMRPGGKTYVLSPSKLIAEADLEHA